MIQSAKRRGNPLTDYERRLTDAEREVVEANMGLVWREAYRVVRRGECVDDMVSAGTFGLMRAVQLYDPEKSRLSTHAVMSIRQAIQRHRLNDRVIHVPVHHVRRGYAPGPECLAAAERVSSVASLDAAGESGASLGSSVADGRNPGPAAEIVEAVREAVDNLPASQRTVVTARLDGVVRSEVGERIGVSGERVRQIEALAHARLRGMLADYA